MDEGLGRRVRGALRAYPTEVWQTCKHWLTLDNTWTSVERLRFRLTMRNLPKWSGFSPAIKAVTADLQMLSADVCDSEPFTSLRDLAASVEYRLTERPVSLGSDQKQEWLVALSGVLLRVTTTDEGDARRIRESAARLAHSSWQPFGDSESLRVTPYVDGAPAGQPQSPPVLWHGASIFVRDGRLAKSFDALVLELARPFAHQAVTEAIKACIQRDRGFIEEYVAEHFVLEAETQTRTVEEQQMVGGSEHELGAKRRRT